MPDLQERIAEATRLTRSGRLAEATRVLRGLAPQAAPGRQAQGAGVVLEGVAEPWAPARQIAGARGSVGGQDGKGHGGGGARAAGAVPSGVGAGWAPGSGEGLARDAGRGAGHGAGTGAARGERVGQFLSRSFTLAPEAQAAGARESGGGGAGLFGAGGGRFGARIAAGAASGLPGMGGAATRPYRLYVPASYDGRPSPLVVMLHGCTQSAADFAAGTRMNEAAEARGCLVAWPEQVAAANASRCWRWFEASEQGRGGEPALVAGITREVMAEYAVDPGRVYVAGLSAGGAAAAVLGEAYPELYAAIGVHSGLACGAARDTVSAMAAMRQPRPGRATAGRAQVLPAIVFHGDADSTVHPGNADAVIGQAGGGAGDGWTRRVEQGQVPGGRAWERVCHAGPDGASVLEQWTVRGAGHAWSGGSAAGSYTDPKGPDASGEMLRFFLEHPRRG